MLRYDQPGEQAAFERWVDLMAQLVQKYGPPLLKSKTSSEELSKDSSRIESLETYQLAA